MCKDSQPFSGWLLVSKLRRAPGCSLADGKTGNPPRCSLLRVGNLIQCPVESAVAFSQPVIELIRQRLFLPLCAGFRDLIARAEEYAIQEACAVVPVSSDNFRDGQSDGGDAGCDVGLVAEGADRDVRADCQIGQFLRRSVIIVLRGDAKTVITGKGESKVAHNTFLAPNSLRQGPLSLVLAWSNVF